MNDKEICPNESGFAPEIQVSWLYYGDIKFRDTFVYEYTPPRFLKVDALLFITELGVRRPHDHGFVFRCAIDSV